MHIELQGLSFCNVGDTIYDRFGFRLFKYCNLFEFLLSFLVCIAGAYLNITSAMATMTVLIAAMNTQKTATKKLAAISTLSVIKQDVFLMSGSVMVTKIVLTGLTSKDVKYSLAMRMSLCKYSYFFHSLWLGLLFQPNTYWSSQVSPEKRYIICR